MPTIERSIEDVIEDNEAPMKPKKPRTDKQKAALKKAQDVRRQNIARKKQESILMEEQCPEVVRDTVLSSYPTIQAKKHFELEQQCCLCSSRSPVSALKRICCGAASYA